MEEKTKDLIASNLVIAFYSAVEPRPAFLGKNKRKADKSVEGLDMRNPSVCPDEVYDVYTRFLKLIDG